MQMSIRELLNNASFDTKQKIQTVLDLSGNLVQVEEFYDKIPDLLAVSLEKAIKIETDPNLRANGESAYSILGEFVLKKIDSIPLEPSTQSEGIDFIYYVSNKLQIPYLSISPGPLDLLQGVEGILYGPFARPIISLPVQSKRTDDAAYMVHFIVNTAAPTTEIPPLAFDKLFGSGKTVMVSNLFVAGELIEVSMCKQEGGNHKDVGVLGADYFRLIRAKLTVDYLGYSCFLQKQ